ncbi:MAG: MFS transporter [Acidobacteriota bacterium]
MTLAGPQGWAWRVCLFLLTATLLSYLDRQALSVVAPRVSLELGLDNAQLGLLLSAFFWTYALMHIFIGYILDRFDIRSTYALFVGLWSIAQIGCGLVSGFGGLITARLFLGAFETAGQTGAARIIARIMPPEDRVFANGIMMSGGSIGAMIAPPLMIWLANGYGWRVGFMVLGAVGIAWAIAFYTWFRPERSLTAAPQPPNPTVPGADWPRILRSARFWSCAAGAFFTIPIIHISSAWVPTYFAQRWSLPLAASLGGYLFLIYAGLDLGFIGGGALVRYLTRRGMAVARSRKIVMAVSAVLILAAAAVPFAQSPLMAVGLIFLMNAGRACWGAIFLAFNQDISPTRVALVAGIFGCIGSLAGGMLVWWIGIISKSHGFEIPFLMIGGLAVAGTIPLLLTAWSE